MTEQEVCIYEDFSKWSDEQKADLIKAIQKGEEWEFSGTAEVESEEEVDHEPAYNEGRD